ncbi:MAG: tRNA (guanosine(46)-N7)-methyltransferase TrmB [Candidatus Cloacimonetes bacterium]|nr:tRNA (guanosine(46)-N7)-methyltransferase TrmB [Candidatus Cloacimonadota bacterium]
MDIKTKEEFFKINLEEGKYLDFEDIFGNNYPLCLEIGSGKGEFIAVQSRFHPETNFIGVELKGKRIITTLKKLDIEKNSNVRLMNLFIDENVTDFIKPNSLDTVIIYHPDPWPKKKHHKRRLIQHKFLDAINPIIKINGYIKISTDDAEYAQWIIDIFKERKDFKSIYPEDFTMINPEDHFTTYFDELQAQEGFETWFMLYKKIAEKN